MKTTYFAIVALFFFLLTSSVIAQTNAAGTNAIAGNVAFSPITPSPSNTVNPLLALVTVSVPLIVALIKKKIWPSVPSAYLPLIAVALGLVITWVMSMSSLTTINPFWGALLGAAGTGLREIKDQLLPASPAPLPERQKPSVPLT